MKSTKKEYKFLVKDRAKKLFELLNKLLIQYPMWNYKLKGIKFDKSSYDRGELIAYNFTITADIVGEYSDHTFPLDINVWIDDETMDFTFIDSWSWNLDNDSFAIYGLNGDTVHEEFERIWFWIAICMFSLREF